ncbi:MAG: hypothetical protein MUP67_02855, partial [Acidimicrobiia bacterium]|nr:hypothetical protein [Acidimicrobiia bacterium]
VRETAEGALGALSALSADLAATPGAAPGVAPAAPARGPAPSPPSTPAPTPGTAAAPAATATGDTHAADRDPGLAIPDYDELSASQVVDRLDGLASGALAGIRAYETAHRGRATILGKLDQLEQTG